MISTEHISEHQEDKSELISGQQVCKFADVEVLRYTLPSYFDGLPINLKKLVYYLSEATLAGRDIYTDQNCRYNLLVRTVLEQIYMHYKGDRQTSSFKDFVCYLRRVWFSNGLHHHYGEDKLKPSFDETYFRQLFESCAKEGYLDLLPSPREGEKVSLDMICKLLYSPDVVARRTVQSGEQDPIQSSSVHFYAEGISSSEVEAFYKDLSSQPGAPHSIGLNTFLDRKETGELVEKRRTSKEGPYASYIQKIIANLKKAKQEETSPQRQEIIQLLIDFYVEGDLRIFDRYCIAWTQDTDSDIDFINGFIETYQDPLGLKGSWEGLVEIIDHKASEQTRLLSQHADWFEQRAPIDEAYRKPNPCGISATVVHVAMLGGDSYPAPPIGINLPNADAIRTKYGSKSIRIENIHAAYDNASSHRKEDELFIPNEEVRQMLERYESQTSRLHTDLHECLGHGSGQLAPGVSADALGQWHSTIEEARADLFALYFIADPKMLELGLLPNQEAYKAEYYRYLHNGLIKQLVRIRSGQRIEEAHMRNRALISRWVIDTLPKEVLEQEGTNLIIHKYEPIREAFGSLLKEIQRIKSCGDALAAKDLVKTYGIEVPQKLHQDILNLYSQLNNPPYKGFVNPRLYCRKDTDGNITDIYPDYTETFDEQMLRYSRTYNGQGSLYSQQLQDIEAIAPDTQTEEAARRIRQALRTRMDGEVASHMRKHGLEYKINFGITRDHLSQLARSEQPSVNLATYLWSRSVRELKLLALRLWPAEELSSNEALRLAVDCEGKAELADELIALLFDRCPKAPAWAMQWLCSGLAVQSIALNTLSRAILRGQYTPNEIELNCLSDICINCISETASSEHYRPKAALLCLERMATISPENRKYIQAQIAILEDNRQKEVQETLSAIRFVLDNA